MLNELKQNKTDNIKTDCLNILQTSNKKICLNHTKNVANKAVELADQYNLEKEKLETAAYLHDISVVIPRDQYVSVCSEHNIEVLELEKDLPILLHQKVSMVIASEIFNINDDDILSAVSCHTTLKANSSQYDMALFIADKLMWDQGGTPPYYNIVDDALSHSLEKACLVYIDYVMDNGMIMVPHPNLIDAREYLATITKK